MNNRSWMRIVQWHLHQPGAPQWIASRRLFRQVGGFAGLRAVAPQPSEDEIRRQLDEVFSRPEFSGHGRETWLMRLGKWLGDILQWLSGLHETAPVLYWALLVGCLVALGLLLTHIGWTVRRVLFTTARLPGSDAPESQRGQLSRTYWEEARRRAAQMDFTEAIRFLFLSLVYRFDESGRVNFQQAYTNREYLALFADRPPVHDQLKVFVDTLDDYWYGLRPTDRRHYEECLAIYEGLTGAQ
jgi:hypothetical protein